MSATLRDIVLSVRYGDAALVGESAGYLVLAATDLAIEVPRQFGLDSLVVFDDGHVEVDASACTHAESEAQLRLLLGQLLALVRTACPNLQRVADRKETRGLRGLQRELEAGLVPVNRKAARRSLARLVREANKSAERGSAAMRAVRVERFAAAPTSATLVPAEATFRGPEVETAPAVEVCALPPVNEVDGGASMTELAAVPRTELPADQAQALSGASLDASPEFSLPGDIAAGGRAAGHSPREILDAHVGRSRWTVAAPPLSHELLSQISARTPVAEWDTAAKELEDEPALRENAEFSLPPYPTVERDCAEDATEMAAQGDPPAATDQCAVEVLAEFTSPPPELVIDTTPTEIYAKVSEAPQPAMDDDQPDSMEMAATPQLAEVSARVARRAEEDLAARLAHPPSRLPPTVRPPSAARTESRRAPLPQSVSLIPEVDEGCERRPSGIEDLLEKMTFGEDSRADLYSGLQQLSRVDWSPLAPPVGSTWMKDGT